MDFSAVILSFMPYWLIYVVACLSPGQNTVITVATALNYNKSKMFLVVLGLAVGGFIWSCVFLLGANVLFVKFSYLIKIIALLGGAYLIYLGIIKLRLVINKNINNDFDVSGSEKVNLKSTSISMFVSGLLTTLSNPKAALLWVSITPLIPIKTNQLSLLIFFSIVIGVIIFTVYSVIGMLFYHSAAQHLYVKNTAKFNLVFAIVFICLGLFLIINGVMPS